MENIGLFLGVARSLGLSGHDMFQTVDLYEAKNLPQVVVTILAIQRLYPTTSPPPPPPPHAQSSQSAAPSPVPSAAPSSSDSTSRLPRAPLLSRQTESPAELSGATTSASVTSAPRTKLPPKGEPKSKSSPRVFTGESEDGLHGRCVTVTVNGVAVALRLGNRLGKGQFGVVYKALNSGTGEVVAIKRIPIVEKDGSSMKDLMGEVELLRSLSHPNITQYHGFAVEGSYLHIVLEYAENGSLLTMIRQFGVLSEPLCCTYTRGILIGLDYLHGKNIAHLDLKCANVLTTKDGTVKLTDFGVSETLTASQRKSNATPGTAYWIAPEIVNLEERLPQSDIWSLGCTVIEMLTGNPPYRDLDQYTALYWIGQREEGPPLPPDLSLALESFLTNCCFVINPLRRATAAQCLTHPWLGAQPD
ncbi:kinase-like domain-containing protein [Zopfochytrium polystomum]|nr:kinase-like domain-containing protein [Zopfochytrium polystomum]